MEKEDYDKWYNSLKNSSGHKKVLNYIDEVFNSENFNEAIKRLRLKYKIPEEGFVAAEEDETFKKFRKENEIDDGIISKSMPPKNWTCEDMKKFYKDIEKVSDKYKLHHLDALNLIENYLFYNDKDFVFDPNGFNLCMLSDLAMERYDPFSKETQKSDDRLYPLAIRISPYASLRDILDFVKRSYNFPIKEYQERYKEDGVSPSDFKKKKNLIQERNNFIYKNKKLPRREIMKLLIKKFGVNNALDVGYIGKIISMEEKRRKKL